MYSVTIYLSECIIIFSKTYRLMIVTLLCPILSEGPTGPVLSTATTVCMRGFGSVRFSVEKGKQNPLTLICTFNLLIALHIGCERYCDGVEGLLVKSFKI